MIRLDSDKVVNIIFAQVIFVCRSRNHTSPNFS